MKCNEYDGCAAFEEYAAALIVTTKIQKIDNILFLRRHNIVSSITKDSQDLTLIYILDTQHTYFKYKNYQNEILHSRLQ